MTYWSPLFQYAEKQEVSEHSIVQQQEAADKNSRTLDPKSSIKELLNNMFHSIYIQQEGNIYKFQPSSQQPKRKELQSLRTKVQAQLYIRQAKKQGICPLRLQVHNQLLDEIIRQCTINCPERGLLLMKVRDQIKMTFSAYETLYEGSLIFGNRKAFSSEIGTQDIKTKIQQLKKKRIQLQNKKSFLQNELQSTERSFREVRALQQKKKYDEITFLRNQSKYLQQFLHNI